MADCFMIFFPASRCNLDRAAEALRENRFNVVLKNHRLVVDWMGGQEFRVELVSESYVREEAIHIGEDTEHAEGMQECDARFEVFIDDLDSALDEINTLIELQGVLQDVSQGYLYLTWNHELSAPWRE